MDFEPSPEAAAIAARVEAFFAAELPPRNADCGAGLGRPFPRRGGAQARLLVFRAAWKLDRQGHTAWGDVSAVKVAVPAMLQGIADRAVQLFGAMGGSDDAPRGSSSSSRICSGHTRSGTTRRA